MKRTGTAKIPLVLEDGTVVFPNDLIDRFANGVQEARKSMDKIFSSSDFLSWKLKAMDARSEHRLVPFLSQCRRHNVGECNAVMDS